MCKTAQLHLCIGRMAEWGGKSQILKFHSQNLKQTCHILSELQQQRAHWRLWTRLCRLCRYHPLCPISVLHIRSLTMSGLQRHTSILTELAQEHSFNPHILSHHHTPTSRWASASLDGYRWTSAHITVINVGHPKDCARASSWQSRFSWLASARVLENTLPEQWVLCECVTVCVAIPWNCMQYLYIMILLSLILDS